MEMTDSPEAFNKYMEDIDMNRLIEEKKEDSFAIPDKPISHKLHKESDNKNVSEKLRCTYIRNLFAIKGRNHIIN